MKRDEVKAAIVSRFKIPNLVVVQNRCCTSIKVLSVSGSELPGKDAVQCLWVLGADYICLILSRYRRD